MELNLRNPTHIRVLVLNKLNTNETLILTLLLTSGYSALVPHANAVPLLDLRQLLMTFVGMLTY
jgi:hypothetical protein